MRDNNNTKPADVMDGVEPCAFGVPGSRPTEHFQKWHDERRKREALQIQIDILRDELATYTTPSGLHDSA